MNSYLGRGWCMEEKSGLPKSNASKVKKVRKTSLRKRPKNLGIKADLMSDVTCSSEEWRI